MSERATAFRKLHERGCFVLPNPWDAGSAVALERLGFAALATSSAGFAFTRGLPDAPDALGADLVLEHVRTVVAATKLPVNADFQAGYAATPEGVRANVRRCAEAGAAGLSIEDATGDDARPLFDVGEAVDRLRAAREGIDEIDANVVLTGRAECFLVGRPDLEDAVRRLRAYADAGADCLFAPGLETIEQIRTVVDAVAPKPVNVLASGPSPWSVEELAGVGARRISVGSALARTAWAGFLRAARSIRAEGRFDALADAASFGELNAMFRDRSG